VLLKCFLGEAVEGECGDGAFEAWGRDAPGALGAAPASEVVVFDPDQTFIHTSFPYCVRLGFALGANGGRNNINAIAEG